MTELETHLLNALKRMEQQFSEQLKASEKAQAALQSMFERTAEDNATLLKQVSFLDNRVTVLSEQLKQFGNLYRQNRR
ncbi:mobilization protein [Salmonella enterica subsp. enterica serovar Uganda]|jgi:septal ring factor EnvC (AmiA/AmiB activator)|uniref:Mobilization protein n=8 Tax=Enterobacterales TaxID=91347 RepID=A0A402UMA4_SALER|nr:MULTISPECIES: MbeD/MobD family mobilization/exclusion protein [Pseudomonadota]ECC3096996.1 mobilization protein [Salmonella enterica subsp. enterica serovar Kisangani]ECC9684541.1 mobilization protein [Salmonella enterica subsp. enterica]ECS1987506.1 mobilization protein [Salmonella enterica subsp. enterica serovar Brandenburg]ECS3833029.1 mobilization protein [Salmonella enterica subsp. enterica serovar Uganda]EDD1410129.1 mobilization protein [Salmonella enterica subsp. enterica serovar L